MQFTQTFMRNDGIEDRATIMARRSKHGYAAVIKIGRITKTVSAGAFLCPQDALTFAARQLANYRDNAIA